MNTEKSTNPKRKPSEFTRFIVIDMDGTEYEVTPEDFHNCPILDKNRPGYASVRQFVNNELARKEPTRAVPRHITYMREHELLNYCEVSEKGHYSWYPKGVLIHRLIADYAARLAREWGAFEMKNPVLIRGDHNLIGELMGEFHERDYRVDGGRGICYLRYAADPLAFPFMQHVRFSHKQSPLKVFEEVNCYRNEQEGEVSGLKRVRGFSMTDMHAACSNVSEAREEFEQLCIKFAALMDNITARGRWVLGWEGTIDFYEENREWLLSIGTRLRVPAFFKLMPQMSHYYAIKNEYQFITEDGANIQVSTVQWDIKDGARFDIGYMDIDNRKHPCPVIIHASSFGSIERTVCAILENAAIDAKNGKTPGFPYWLAPTQARIVPVKDDYLEVAKELCRELSDHDIRADIDDRQETVGKKIRSGEKDWVPFLLVIGEREVESGLLSVRDRETGKQDTMSKEEFIKMIKEKQGGNPFRPLPLPELLSKRPVFL